VIGAKPHIAQPFVYAAQNVEARSCRHVDPGRNARNGANLDHSPTLPLAASPSLAFSYNVTIGIPVYIEIAGFFGGPSFRSPSRRFSTTPCSGGKMTTDRVGRPAAKTKTKNQTRTKTRTKTKR
jgi:hypothetical protein